mmetsp:Transcript_27508/g.24387  ORF Transcript_27508/g.24387 Transcript_27508/m.24387 type:complete len:112 (-) Transcript_27508:38-373(-)
MAQGKLNLKRNNLKKHHLPRKHHTTNRANSKQKLNKLGIIKKDFKFKAKITETIESIMSERAILSKDHISLDKERMKGLKMVRTRVIKHKKAKERSKLKKLKIMADIKDAA